MRVDITQPPDKGQRYVYAEGMTSNGIKQGAAGAIFCVALTAIGLMVRTGTAVSDTQEAVGRSLFAAGLLGVMVALVAIAVSMLRSDGN